MDVVGYTNRLGVAAGEDVQLMVSCDAAEYALDVVRVFHGDTNPDGPGPKVTAVASEIESTYPGRAQELELGSYFEAGDLAIPKTATAALWACPLGPLDRARALLGTPDWREGGIALIRAADGRVALWQRGEQVATTESPIADGSWTFVAAGFDAGGSVVLATAPAGGHLSLVRVQASDERPTATGEDFKGPFRVGAADRRSHFNGKLEAPSVFARVLAESELAALHENSAVAASLPGSLGVWDLGSDRLSTTVRDLSGNGNDGRLLNRPLRGVTGHRWDRSETDPRLAPDQYEAAHFHDDDLDDAGWEVALTWTVPDDLASGVYGFRLRTESSEDIVPVFVRPGRGAPTADVALVLPTFTYVAYANDRIMARDSVRDAYRELGIEIDYPSRPADHYINEKGLLSVYDFHSDGTGVCHASWLRPMVDVRTDYLECDLSSGRGAPHCFAADLHLVDWLAHEGIEVDILTDEHLHAEGSSALDPYRVVLTGTHPEYVSGEILDAFEGYLDEGGRVMYLGGNGFYWVAELDPEDEHTIEIRRCGPATRAWEMPPGEWHLSASGKLGGLWRFRGRAPQRLFGVGFGAQGYGARGSGYERAEASFDPRNSFVFEGLDDDQLEIGAQPALVNDWGAAGFEVDRYDRELGSPPDTAILATAKAFGDEYCEAVDDVLSARPGLCGASNPNVRADMVLVRHSGGGMVFSPGSISWCSCLSHNEYDNTVSRVTGNVLRAFVSDDALAAPATTAEEIEA